VGPTTAKTPPGEAECARRGAINSRPAAFLRGKSKKSRATLQNEAFFSSLLIVIVALKVAILAFNSGHCPLTGIKVRYTSDRRDNFDIYLPEWLASRTMIIFGPLFLIGLIIAAVLRWAPRP
jgi:hypothetical protein